MAFEVDEEQRHTNQAKKQGVIKGQETRNHDQKRDVVFKLGPEPDSFL